MTKSIFVIMTTYFPEGIAGKKRGAIAVNTAVSWATNLHADGRDIQLMVSDDGSDPEHEKFLDLIVRAWKRRGLTATIERSDRKGVGGSLNERLAYLQKTHPEAFWIYTTDDWALEKPLDLQPALRLMDSIGYDIVRLLPLHPNLKCQTRFYEPIGWWLDIDVKYGGFAFATRPFLARVGLTQKYGKFTPKVNAYVTEQDFAKKLNAADVKIAALVDLHGPWRHLGDDPEVEVGTIEP